MNCSKVSARYSVMGGICMYAMNLVDVADMRTNYGILFCGNDEITENVIQKKICEIKEQMENEDKEWVVDDVIEMLPNEWKIELQCKTKQIVI